MKTGDIAALLVQGMQSQITGTSDIGYHIGTVLSWDDETALNTVQINGNEFNNLRVITAGPAISIETGDTVVVVRFQTQYFILGKVAAPGASAAIRAVGDLANGGGSTTSTTFTNLTNDASSGPSVNAFVGKSGLVQVTISTVVTSNNPNVGSGGEMSFAISGANSVVASSFGAAIASFDGNWQVSATNTILLELPNVGLTTFTAKYRSQFANQVFFNNRSIVVTPM